MRCGEGRGAAKAGALVPGVCLELDHDWVVGVAAATRATGVHTSGVFISTRTFGDVPVPWFLGAELTAGLRP